MSLPSAEGVQCCSARVPSACPEQGAFGGEVQECFLLLLLDRNPLPIGASLPVLLPGWGNHWLLNHRVAHWLLQGRLGHCVLGKKKRYFL